MTIHEGDADMSGTETLGILAVTITEADPGVDWHYLPLPLPYIPCLYWSTSRRDEPQRLPYLPRLQFKYGTVGLWTWWFSVAVGLVRYDDVFGPDDDEDASYAALADNPGRFRRTWRRFFGVPVSADAPALCEACVSPTITLICDDTRRPNVGEILRHPTDFIRFHAPLMGELTVWCSDHAAEADRPGVNSWFYWLPSPTALTWREVADYYTHTEQPGCCRCDGIKGPARYAVWGPDADADDWGGEGYCAACMATPTTWHPGSTYADIGAQYTLDDYDRATEAAFRGRVPIPAELCTSVPR